MSTEEKKAPHPQLIKLNKAFKLAEQWCNNMSKSTDDELVEQQMEGRPPGLGLGAIVPCHRKLVRSNDPVERKLLSRLDVERRKAAKSAEGAASPPREAAVDDDSEDEELESRAKAFVKKRATSLTSPLEAKKRKK